MAYTSHDLKRPYWQEARYRVSLPKRALSGQGFTLIEILISVGILMFLMSLSLVHFGTADKNEFLRYAARRLADSLQSSVSFAHSGTLAQYPSAQSYGVHTDLASQQIVLFADQNTSTGIGHWDGGAEDSNGNKDALMRDALAYAIPGKGEVMLENIEVHYRSSGETRTLVASSVDVAAVPPNAHLTFVGIVDAATGAEALVSDVEKVTFTLRLPSTGKATTVTVYALSGRIDVDY